MTSPKPGTALLHACFRIRWTDPVHYDLLKKIIEFNIKEKAENPGFWR